MARRPEKEICENTPQTPYVSEYDENGERKPEFLRKSREWRVHPEGMYFSPATETASQWIEFWASNFNSCKKLEKWSEVYEAYDLDALNLAVMNQDTIVKFTEKYYTDKNEVCPPMINWEMVAQDYDGIYIDPSPVEMFLPDGEGGMRKSSRWSYFLHMFDVDTLVIWRGARMKRLGTLQEFLPADYCKRNWPNCEKCNHKDISLV